MTTQHTIDLDELERLAKAATPGPWETYIDIVDGCSYIATGLIDIGNIFGMNDATYIAAANPATFLQMIGMVRKWSEKCDRFERDEQSARKVADELLAALERIVTDLSDNDEEGLIEHTEQMMQAREAIANYREQP